MREEWIHLEEKRLPKYIKQSPERVIEILAPFLTERRRQRIEKVLNQRIGKLKVVFDRPYDPHNCGAALRSCEGFGIQYVDIIKHPSRDFFISKKVAQGSHFWLSIKLFDSPQSWINSIKDIKEFIIGGDPKGIPIEELKTPPLPIILIIGNEHDGLTPEIKEICHKLVSIPMFGFTESFNLSVATALLLSYITKLLPRGDINEEEKLRIKALWYYRSCEEAPLLLEKYWSNSE